MSKTVHLIGGPGDGRVVEVRDDVHRLRLAVTPSLDLSAELPPSTPTVVETVYYERALWWLGESEDDVLQVWAPDGWSVMRTFRRLLECYQPS